MIFAHHLPNLSTFSLNLELPYDLQAFFHSFGNAQRELRRFNFIYNILYAYAYAYINAYEYEYEYAYEYAYYMLFALSNFLFKKNN